METIQLFRILIILASFCTHYVWGSSIGTTSINCVSGSDLTVGTVTEPYTGDVEMLTNIQAADQLALQFHIFPTGVTFLELVHNPGSSTAVVRTTKPLDADMDQAGGELYYSITCTNTGMRNTRKVIINDINDNAPVFVSKQYTKSVLETAAVYSDVLKVEAKDKDSSTINNRVIYSIEPPAPSVFTVRDDGSIRLTSRLNYNTQNVYTFVVKAQDNGGLSDTTTVTIRVEDTDNLNPYFDHSFYVASIPENQSGPLPAISPAAIKAQDGDQGINIPVNYSITSVTPDKYMGNFIIGSSNGIISVTTALDREEVDAITVSIKAVQQDDTSKGASAVVSVTIEDINDNPPAFDQNPYEVEIPENSKTGSFVLQPKVTDLDQGGFVGTFHIIPDSVPFSVNNDGTIIVKNSAELDREASAAFTFQVVATEDAVPNQSTTSTVSVTLLDENDNSPQFGSASYEGKVFSNQTTGMLVAKVDATDRDEGANGVVKYAIVLGNEEGYFSIDENTGEITLAKEIPLSQNMVLQFSLHVTATDGGSIPRTSSVLVNIKAPGDSRPQFLHKNYLGKVEEEKEPGTEIVKLDFLSVGPVVPVTLAVITEADKFTIDQSTGMLSTLIKLDFETQSTYTIQVSLTDGTHYDDASVQIDVIDVNDNSPVFAPSTISRSVPEDLAIGNNITTVSATDLDAGLNGQIQYFLQGGAGYFSVDTETGLITLAASLDRETQSEHTLEVIARDQGAPSRMATATVVVTVTDVNDNAPVFSKPFYEAVASETEAVGTVLVNLSATDKDEGSSGTVKYRIARQDPSSAPPVFVVDPTSGSLSLAEKLDYSVAKGYTLSVEAVDEGTPALTGSSVVTVVVEDVNDKPPQFSQEQYDVAVPESTPSGGALISVEVTDEDEGGFSNGHFLLTSDTFSINKQGVLSLKDGATLDREKRDNYVIQVVAVDQPVNGLSSTAQINITVLDVNDNNPEFLPFPDPIQIPEGLYTSDSPGVICLISATDDDIGDNGRISISTNSHSDLFTFRNDGTLLAIGELDREIQDVYALVIAATDYGTPQRNTISSIRVIITDVNDNAPVFSAESYTKSILLRDAKAGDLVLTLSATDKDSGSNSLITYSFVTGSSVLALDGATGAITLTSSITAVTEDTLLNLTAKAQDNGTPPKSATATVLVHLKTVTLDEGVNFESSSYNFTVKENMPKETDVGVVKALSSSTLIEINYKLTTHTDLFSVDATGTIKTLRSLDKETQEWYILTVEAHDSNTPPDTALTMVTIQVENVNEVPVFASQSYQAEIFSIAPFKSPVVQVKATDPDVGESSELVYSLVKSSTLCDVEPSTGQVYVVSAAGQAGQHTIEVKATDKNGLFATTQVHVKVKESNTNNIAVISVNQQIGVVEKKIPELQVALSSVLGWNVNILTISSANSGGTDMRTLVKNTDKTYISFIAMRTDGTIIPAEEVRKELKNKDQEVKETLKEVFNDSNLEHGVEEAPSDPDNQSNMTIVIALSAVLAVAIVALIITVTVLVVKTKKMKRSESREVLYIKQQQDVVPWTVDGQLDKGQGSVRSDRRSSSGRNEEISPEMTDNQATSTFALDRRHSGDSAASLPPTKHTLPRVSIAYDVDGDDDVFSAL